MDVHRWQRREAVCLLGAAVATAVLFAPGTLDVAAARWFFRPDAIEHWPLARQSPWLILYRAAPWITAALLAAGFAAFALSLTPRRRYWRGAATLALLAVATRPGRARRIHALRASAADGPRGGRFLSVRALHRGVSLRSRLVDLQA
ncbi:MAG TPA: hypothetical protein VGH61_12650, partial [Steroidobacteraceae bacterium]